jgi:hypothetical protein
MSQVVRLVITSVTKSWWRNRLYSRYDDRSVSPTLNARAGFDPLGYSRSSPTRFAGAVHFLELGDSVCARPSAARYGISTYSYEAGRRTAESARVGLRRYFATLELHEHPFRRLTSRPDPDRSLVK